MKFFSFLLMAYCLFTMLGHIVDRNEAMFMMYFVLMWVIMLNSKLDDILKEIEVRKILYALRKNRKHLAIEDDNAKDS